MALHFYPWHVAALALAREALVVLPAHADDWAPELDLERCVAAKRLPGRSGTDILRQHEDGAVLVDTGGRLHAQRNRMDELNELRRVLATRLPGAHETWLVLDATHGPERDPAGARIVAPLRLDAAGGWAQR